MVNTIRSKSLLVVLLTISITTVACGKESTPTSVANTNTPAISTSGHLKFMEGNDCTQDIVGEATDEVGQEINIKKTSGFTNDEARSVLISNVQVGIVLKVYDNPDGKQSDDWTEVFVKKQVLEYCITSFEQTYEDDVVQVFFHQNNGLDGKVSRIEIYSGSYVALPADIPPPIITQLPESTITHTPSQATTATAIEERETALVVQVTDGDTIKVLIGDVLWDLRYIGIDAPEGGQPYSSEALNANTQLVGGQTILLEKDISETDRYGRLLRYVFLLNGTFVNAELVRLGFAEVKAYPPDVKYHEQIFEHQLEAKENGLGIWAELAIAATATEPALSATSTEPAEIATATQSEEVANVIILDIFYDGVVPRVESDEYAIVKNVGASQVNMNGWRLNAGAPGQNFYFPDIIIQPGKTCRVYTNEYHPEYCSLSFNSSSAIWNNQGDCGYLFNAKGEQVSQYCH